MKYLYFGIIVLVAFLSSYWLIPKIIVSSIHVKSNCKTQTLLRLVYNQKYINDSLGTLKYNLIPDDFANPTLLINLGSKAINVTLNNYQNSSKEDMIMGSYSLKSGSSPFEKIKYFYLNYKYKSEIEKIIKKISSNCEDLTIAYGGQIILTNLIDSTLIYIKTSTDSFPSVKEIYNKIKILEDYAKINGAKRTNHPMLNIKKISAENLKYEFSIALPINKDLPPFENISPKRMLAGGKFLTSTAKGGFNSVAKMEISLEHYLSDYAYSSPAIPFQSLVTNRMIQKDSTQWVTKLYYPIF